MFEPGREYTRSEIHAYVGGSRRACLPTRDGEIVAACLLTSFNPEAPHVVLCGIGARNGPAGALLADQRTAIPFFTRVAANRWRFEGRFVATGSWTAGPLFDRHVARSTRAAADVSRVVVLERVDAPTPARIHRDAPGLKQNAGSCTRLARGPSISRQQTKGKT